MDHKNQTHHAEQPNGPRADPAPPLRERAETAFRANVIKALRAVFGGTLPALIITGDTDPRLVRSMDKQGIAIQYKPLKMDSLQAVISQAAERRSA